ncbi:MAG: AsnC family transcriptional regulator, partial [Actinobacteria bacterium]|nr:AsnC family transcriptional regulator [Actinomycetota bacterium]
MADDDLHPHDERIIAMLSADARMTNAALAEALGVAPSTA